MMQRDFGTTGLRVSVLGLGAGQVGATSLDETAAAALLNGALDAGITLIDTARGYGLSEERIGRHLASRRDEFILSSKCGYGIPGIPDWTSPCITAGVDAALSKLKTDRLDIMHLHSCPLAVLQQGEVVTALERARKEGKIRCAAYSGENEALAWAAASGHFDSLQTSVNICDQRSLRDVLPTASKAGLGIIAKRPIANAFWRHKEQPKGDYCEVYWTRAKEMNLTPGELTWDDFALRFSAFAPGVSTAIAGTAKLDHLRHNIAIVARGPLPEAMVQDVMDRFAQCGAEWPGEV